MTVIGITHNEDQLSRFYEPEDLERLRAHAEIRILGHPEAPGFYDQLADVTVLTGSWGMVELNETLLRAAPNLQAVCYAAGSVKYFVTDASYARGVHITTAMHANAIPVAEVTLALIILTNKRWFASQDEIRQGGMAVHQQLKETGSRGNYGATIGLIGFGAIGREVVARLQSLHLRVIVADPFASAESVAQAGAELVSMEDLARQSDVVSLHAPNIPETQHMINADFLGLMKDQSTFINTARGALVDEDALVAELETGRIFAMLDVTFPEPPEDGHPFYRLPNCWLTPHRAGSSGDEIRRMGHYAIEECLRYVRGEPFRYPVTQDMLATMA